MYAERIVLTYTTSSDTAARGGTTTSGTATGGDAGYSRPRRPFKRAINNVGGNGAGAGGFSTSGDATGGTGGRNGGGNAFSGAVGGAVEFVRDIFENRHWLGLDEHLFQLHELNARWQPADILTYANRKQNPNVIHLLNFPFLFPERGVPVGL